MTSTPRTVADWAEAVRTANPRGSAAHVWDLAYRLYRRHPGASVRVEDGVLEVLHRGPLDHIASGWERVSA